MKNENNLVIQKADKGNTIAILDKDSCLKSVETLLKDSSKFRSIRVAPDKDLNYIINSEKIATDLLKKLKNKNDHHSDLFIQRLVSQHTNIQIYKFLVPVLSDITQSEFTVKDSFTFVDEILTRNSDLSMASLDVDALFTNIPLDEVIDICV